MKKVRTAARTLKIGFKGICSTVDESVMDWDYTPEMLNYRIEGGVLTGKLGFMNGAGFHSSMQGFRHYYPDLPEGVTVEKLFHYRRRESGAYDDRLVMQTAAGELYYTAVFANDTWHLVADATVSGDASAVSYNYGGKDVLLISARNSGFLILDDATVKTVPCPLVLSKVMRPPSSSTILRESASPKPLPLLLVVKLGTKILSRMSSGIPGPLSRMVTRTWSPVVRRVMSIRASSWPLIAWTAF